MRESVLAVAVVLSAAVPACAQLGADKAVASASESRNGDLEAIAAKGVSIALVAYRGGERVESAGFGGADPVRSLFRVYSLAKPMTATAAARLMSQGKLRPDADIRSYLPNFPDKGAPITPMMLATHRSGIRHYRGDEAITSCADLDAALAQFAEDPLVAVPGSREHYSSHGYVVLSAVIAAAAELPFDQAMDRLVFDPAGIDPVLEDDSATLPALNEDADGSTVPSVESDISCKFGAGGYLASAEDVARFARAMFDGTLLPPQSQALFLRGGETYSAQGIGEGGTAMFAVRPASDDVLVLLANVSGPTLGPALKAAFDRRVAAWGAAN